ncbi:amino acid ABC transporter permease [Micromonospora cremea]|uniref:Amino acid ABC transporter membrane protein 1, PAAT family n=1 Tax=Micromonospora cremea TaxID=709881 RepID=A0A1N5UFH5_9ACTN|nr:amino acid ABC transporter membrane protein 1, PAAT family [Micromonospora cremea]
MDAFTDNIDLFWSGYLRSVGICLWALVGSLALGLVLAAMRVSPIPPLRALAAGFVNALRNTPLALVLFFMAFGLPELGINASYYLFAVAGLILYTAAFVCEAVRSGINTVPAGQAEAARSIGMTFAQSLSTVVLPQAVRTVVPPLASVIIAMFKNSAVVGAFGVGRDLFSVSGTLTSAQGYPNLPVLTGVAVGYLAITIPAALLLHVIERRVAFTQ